MPATHDLYGPVHKGLRLGMSRMLVRLGAADPADGGLPQLLADLREQCRLSEDHLAHEDRVIHTALELRAPGSSIRPVQAHERHRHTFGELEAAIRTVESAAPTAKSGALRALYLRFSLFVADDLAHMAEEEQLMLPILQALFTDAELMAMEDRIISGLSPEQMVAVGRLMLPAATRSDRILMLDAIRANAPAEAFAAILQLAVPRSLSPTDVEHLSEALGLDLGLAA